MLWYLLYGLRGTSEPPALRDDSPLRAWMSGVGLAVARHALATIAIAVSVGIYLSIPMFPLCGRTVPMERPGASSHAWTSLQPLPTRDSLIPDISVRQLWVYGNSAEALERDTILEAASIQEAMLGSASNWATATWGTEAGGSPEEITPSADAFIHSPLLYWNSSSAVGSRDSILAVVNSRMGNKSPANITLTPTSVLSGLVWSNGRIVTADALIISLFQRKGSHAGEDWNERARTLDRVEEGGREIYFPDATRSASKLFKFQSRPVSFWDDAAFFTAYTLVALLVARGFKHLKPLRSRAGLLAAMILQGLFSLYCSLTVASFLHMDVSSIPPEAYPFTVLVGALDNMFRLVHEVERTPLVNQPEHRVSMALGSVGHVLLTTVAQNACILILLSFALNTGLAAFCYFAALSLVVDMFFFWSLFVAALSLNLERHGMLDSIENAPQRQTERNESSTKQDRTSRLQIWQKQQAILRYPRIMGTVAILAFIFILALHFPIPFSLEFRSSRAIACEPKGAYTYHSTQLSPKSGQIADSTVWLARQDSHTIKEIFRLAGTGSTRFIARIYDPVIVMPRFAGGNILRQQCIPQQSPANGYTRGLLVLIVCCVLIFAISNYFAHPTQREEESNIQNPGSISSVRYLPHGHSLDVYLLSASRKPYLASVGFDHEIRYWDLGSCGNSDIPFTLSELHGIWPAAAIAVDDNGEWVAICSKSGDIGVWNVQQRSGRTISASLASEIVLCSFLPCAIHGSPSSAPSLLIVGTDGLLVDVATETGNVTSHRICGKHIRSSHLDSNRPMLPRLMSTSEEDEMYTTVRREGRWFTQLLRVTPFISPQPAHLRFTTLSDLRMVGLAFDTNTSQLYLIDILSAAPIYVFQPKPFREDTLRTLHSQPQQCLSCGAFALASFSIAYTETSDGRLTMHTLSAEPNPYITTGLICLRSERDVRERRCLGFDSSREQSFSMLHAGSWESTAANGVAGVRRATTDACGMHDNSIEGSVVSRRRQRKTRVEPTSDEEEWEAWTMSARGVISIHPLRIDAFATRVGPIKPIGRNAIAVGLAEDIVVIQFGKRIYDNDDDNENLVKRRATHSRLAGRSKSG